MMSNLPAKYGSQLDAYVELQYIFQRGPSVVLSHRSIAISLSKRFPSTHILYIYRMNGKREKNDSDTLASCE